MGTPPLPCRPPAADDYRQHTGRRLASEPASRPYGSVRALWIPAFDGIRGSLSVAIALTHISLATGWRPNHEPFRALRGSMSFFIEFLFLLGGFAVFLPVVAYGGLVGIRTYALRRAGRLLPLYWLTLAIAVAMGPLLRPISGANFPHDWTAVLGHVLFLQQELYPGQRASGSRGSCGRCRSPRCSASSIRWWCARICAGPSLGWRPQSV